MQLTPAVGFIKLQTLVPLMHSSVFPLMHSSVFPFIKVFILGTCCLLQDPALVELPQLTLIVADYTSWSTLMLLPGLMNVS